MKITLLGHASVFIEMTQTRCLMDPVFQDPFEDSAVVSCPRRSIALDKIPPIELLVISHAHLDHFDIPSLAHVARTSRKCEVLCPKDAAIVYALEALGFENIHPEASRQHFQFEKYEVITTHSHVKNVIEFGVVFKDKTGTFWNQVDSLITPADAPSTVKQAGKIDLLFAMYASQNFKFFESRGTGFPHALHEMNLSTVMAVNPRLAVPGSAGFRFAGAGMEWCNSFLFPMSRERFVTDLARIAPAIPTRIANPGDVFEIQRGVVEHRPQSSLMAKMLEDDTEKLRFDPTAPIPPLQDPNPNGLATVQLAQGVEDVLEAFLRFVRDACASTSDPLVEEYRRCRASYAVGVVFPDGPERWLRITLDESDPRFERCDALLTPADAGHRIVASALAAWATREKSYFYLRAFSRKWSALYELVEKEGRATLTTKDPQDLLAYYFERKAEGADVAVKQWLDFQLKPYVRRRN